MLCKRQRLLFPLLSFLVFTRHPKLWRFVCYKGIPEVEACNGEKQGYRSAQCFDGSCRVSRGNARKKDNVLPRMLSTLDAAQKQAHASQLVTSAKVIMHLAVQGLAFRGHDESSTSVNRGNFLETRDFLIRDHAELELALANVPQNAKYTSPVVQKDLTRAAADLIRQQIRQELGDGYYCLVVDEAICESKKEWMSVVLRFVEKTWVIRERFAGAVHVEDTKADTLFQHLVSFIHNFGLDMSKLRGQAFDGASNMRGVFNGLQALVRAMAPFAFMSIVSHTV